MPHLTIVKMSDETQAQQAYRVAHERWAHFDGSREILVSELTFVREDEQNCWVDLAGVPLGRQLVSYTGVRRQTSDLRKISHGFADSTDQIFYLVLPYPCESVKSVAAVF